MTRVRRRARGLSELLFGLLLGAGGLGLLGQTPHALADAPAAAPAAPAVISPTPAPREAPLSAPAEIASYKLDARLDVPSHLVTGKGTLTWKNPSSKPVRELWFHLYLNAFKNDRSLFLRSPFGAGRSGQHASDYGYIDVTSLRVRELGGADLWPGADKTSPNDPDDQTDIRLPLPSEIAAGAVVNVDFEWTSKLPNIVERTGYAGGFHMLGQWFPKLAKLEPDGTWAHFAFHPQAEFYADFGRYSVNIDVPENMKVGATGRLAEDKTESGRRLLRFEAENVHDFAWTAWDRFREKREKIENVDVRVLYPPGFDAAATRILECVRFALPRFNRLYGVYPHPTLTVVHPPEDATYAGGMEYPTLITSGGRWYMPLLGIRNVEGVTVHELGHQWFQGLIATNEPEWPVLDEGLNQFAELSTMEDHYGPGGALDFGDVQLSPYALYRGIAVRYGREEPIAQPASHFASFDGLGGLVYARTAMVLATIGNVWGRDALQNALGEYARRFRFKNPEPRDLLETVRETLGEEPAEVLRVALFDRGWVDYAAEKLECITLEPAGGVFDKAGGRELREHKNTGETTYNCRVLVRREGTLKFPVDIDLVLASGAVERRHWDGHGYWTSVEYEGRERVIAALVDPEVKILIDQRLGNNCERTPATLGMRSLERATYWGELALGWLGP